MKCIPYIGDSVWGMISQETGLILNNGGHHCETETKFTHSELHLRLIWLSIEGLQLNALWEQGVSPSIHEASETHVSDPFADTTSASVGMGHLSITTSTCPEIQGSHFPPSYQIEHRKKRQRRFKLNKTLIHSFCSFIHSLIPCTVHTSDLRFHCEDDWKACVTYMWINVQRCTTK